MNSALREETHRLMVTRMLVAGIPNPEQATDVAIEAMEEIIEQAGKAILYDQKEIDHRLSLMRRGYMRSSVLGPEDKARHIAVETAKITGVSYGGTVEKRERGRYE